MQLHRLELVRAIAQLVACSAFVLSLGTQAVAQDAGAPSGPSASDASTPLDAGGPLQPADGGAESAFACSCEAALDQGGRVHVCSESHEPPVCAELGCEQGTRRETPCPKRARARLCCDMSAAGLSTILYDDCSHPNCELGFRVQCRDFGGDLYVGQCSSGVSAPSIDAGSYTDGPSTGGQGPDSGDSSCAAVPLVRRSGRPWLVLALSVLARVAWSRRARRKPLRA